MIDTIVVILLGIFLFSVSGAPDNEGKEFIIAFMENSNYYGQVLPLELFITTGSTHLVLVNVTSPKWKKPFINEMFTVTAGKVQQLTIDVGLRLKGCELQSKAILIQASHEIVIYGINKQKNSNDAFLGLPTDVLGTKYFTVTYYPPYRKTQILIVGIEDDTEIDIFLTATTTLYSNKYMKGEVFSQIINKYDTLQLQSKDDFTGTLIKSSKPVNVFSGNIKTNVGSKGSQDHLVENLTPVEKWGKTFATVPIPERTTGDLFKIIANNQTKVLFRCVRNNTYNNFTIILQAAGNFHQRHIASGTYCSIESTEAILVVQIVKSQRSSSEPADPAMIIIPPIGQYAADYTFSTPAYSGGSYENYFMFVVKKIDLTGLRIDKKVFPKNTIYVKIPGTELVGGYIHVSNGPHKVNHISPISVFCGFLYGRANLETYGFPVGMRMANINAVCITTISTEGDGIDNDCDGLIDEELCHPGQGVPDDDGDGKVNEDCAKLYTGFYTDNDGSSNVTEDSDDDGSGKINENCDKFDKGVCDCAGSKRSTDLEESQKAKNIPLDQGLASQEMSELRRELLINRKKTKRYMNSLSSSPDTRTSATLIGYTSAVLLILICVGTVISDASVLYMHVIKAKNIIKLFFKRHRCSLLFKRHRCTITVR